MLPPQKIGLIAGQGTLPELLLSKWEEQGIMPVVIALKDITPLSLTMGRCASVFSIGQAGHILHFLKSQGVTRVVMAGGLKRPNFWTLRTDWDGFKIILKVLFRRVGDDTLLKIIRDEIKKRDIDVVGAHEFIPDILCPIGVLGTIHPDKEDLEIIKKGFMAAKQHGANDKGQSIVVNKNNGICGFEDAKGTNALIRACQKFSNPILVKVSKPQQDLALDMPTIGLPTVENARLSGFKGIVVESGKTIILDKNAVIENCNKAGLFIMGMVE